MPKHRKHAKLKLRNNDVFAPNEIAILGSSCSKIAYLVKIISERLSTYKIGYFDASHDKNLTVNSVANYTFHASGALRTDQNVAINKFNQRIQFAAYDLVFINGNHYQGAKQILILDPDKKASVQKRLNQLNAVQFVIKSDEHSTYFDFLKAHQPTIENLHSYNLNEIDQIVRHIENLIKEHIAPVQGLVLAGGKSIRMGKDKGTLNFFGKKQREVAIDLLSANRLKTYLSVRADQEIEMEHKITDVFIGLGPFGAICSAFQHDPNKAWLVLATDLPFIDDTVIKLLLQERDPSKIATSIKGKGKEFPEPLITIWEPKSYPVLMSYLAQGYSCPRKVLINSDVKIVEVADSYIRNINTPEDFTSALKELNE